ncbi:MAG: hypothetical protein GEV05_24985 [Betaproteobacteria bacterium]|nr:hypothetical protein [Betaproteobacteria bacterium]
MRTEPNPIACALTGQQLEDRLASIQELARDALSHAERHDLVLQLSYRADAAARVRAMVRKEEECCSFLTFEVREHAGAVQVTITAPEEARAAASFLFEQFIARDPAPGTGACCGPQGRCSP